MFVYFSGSWYSFFHGYSLGIVFGLVAYACFLNSIILSARLKALDRIYGHDKALVLHSLISSAGFFFSVLHFAIKRAYYPEASTQTIVGIVSLSMYCLIVLLALFVMSPLLCGLSNKMAFIRNRLLTIKLLDYNLLKSFHNLSVVSAIIMTVHVLLADTTRETVLRTGLMALWAVAAFLLYIYHKLLVPMLSKMRGWQVTAVEHLSENITKFEFTKKCGKFVHHPGQYCYVRILSKVCGYEEHPFTISSPPNSGNTIAVIIKNLGNYTTKAKLVKVGSKVIVDGPYGTFYPSHGDKQFLLIAGGIGITPFISMVNHWNNTSFPRLSALIWSCREEKEMIQAEMFKRCAEINRSFLFFPVLTRQTSGTVQLCRINKEVLAECLTLFDKTALKVMFCGPSTLRTYVNKSLLQLGVEHSCFQFEKFN